MRMGTFPPFTQLIDLATRQSLSPVDRPARSSISTGNPERLRIGGTSAQTTSLDSGGTKTRAFRRSLATPPGSSPGWVCWTCWHRVKAFSQALRAVGGTVDLKASWPDCPSLEV